MTNDDAPRQNLGEIPGTWGTDIHGCDFIPNHSAGIYAPPGIAPLRIHRDRFGCLIEPPQVRIFHPTDRLTGLALRLLAVSNAWRHD